MVLVQVAQRVEDLQRATAFYATLLGASALASFDPPGIAFFTLGDTRPVQRLMLDVNASSALHYFGVDDVRVRIDALRQDGITIESEPHVIFSHTDATLGPAGTDEWQAFIRDSEGNLVGLVSQLPAEK